MFFANITSVGELIQVNVSQQRRLRMTQILCIVATSSIYASARCGLTGRSTGHFAAVQVWAQKA